MKVTFSDAVSYFKSCSAEELEKITEAILSVVPTSIEDISVSTQVKLLCPVCKNEHFVRNGHSKAGVQHYLCKNCGKSFSSSTNTILQNTKLPISLWVKYIKCMVDGLSVRQAAKFCGLTRTTSFLWRRKILNAMSDYMFKNKELQDELFILDGAAHSRYNAWHWFRYLRKIIDSDGNILLSKNNIEKLLDDTSCLTKFQKVTLKRATEKGTPTYNFLKGLNLPCRKKMLEEFLRRNSDVGRHGESIFNQT